MGKVKEGTVLKYSARFNVGTKKNKCIRITVMKKKYDEIT